MNFDEAALYLHGLTRLGIKLGNDRFAALLARLGDPQDGFKAIHIAGTKGKGSTATFASSILRSAGYKVGTYLSPFVYNIRERVQIDGEMISEDDFARISSKIRPIAEELAESEHGPTTEFEYKTAIGFCYFAERQVDYAVIEVGLGGRLDATNVLKNPIVSVITNIGYDHTNLLGNTLREIAGEKAGIIKQDGLCVTGAQNEEAHERIAEVCVERGAHLHDVVPYENWGVDAAQRLWVRTPRRELSGLHLGLQGEFQKANAAVAVHALDCARDESLHISDEAMRCGLAGACLPGRLEIVREADPTIIVDAAHNEMAATALSEALRHEFRAQDRPLLFVIGMSKGHEPHEFLAALFDGFDLSRVILIATEPHFRPREAEEVAEAARQLGIGRILTEPQPTLAAFAAIDLAQDGMDDALIVVTGSFYTIGELSPQRWQAIFAEHGLNTPIPANIWQNQSRVIA